MDVVPPNIPCADVLLNSTISKISHSICSACAREFAAYCQNGKATVTEPECYIESDIPEKYDGTDKRMHTSNAL